MCGLSGLYSRNYEIINKEKLKKILSHRGPDNFQVYEYNNDILISWHLTDFLYNRLEQTIKSTIQI